MVVAAVRNHAAEEQERAPLLLRCSFSSLRGLSRRDRRLFTGRGFVMRAASK